ncbi:hypothetical protein PBI_INGRID_40 [Arthrobacter phage Ingrid]|nr:hypothetical protein PBI_INGRID_40 [Arthrobacter phage Ingrid]QFG11022.1 hypothetical protein PBI_LORETTA_40 [Arthrobacter phage Loretta]
MSAVKKGIQAVAHQWNKRKGTIAVVATLTTIGAMKLNRHNIEAMNQFAEAHGLLDEFMKQRIKIVKYAEDV